MDKSTHEEHLYQALQIKKKKFKIAVTFLTGYNGIFNVTNSKKSFISKKQLLTKMILFKLVYHREFMELEA